MTNRYGMAVNDKGQVEKEGKRLVWSSTDLGWEDAPTYEDLIQATVTLLDKK